MFLTFLRRHHPAMTQIALLSLIGGILGTWGAHMLLLKLQTGAHGDFFWSWAIGHWQWQHHQIFLNNPAAWNGSAIAGPWVNLEWGWQALLGGLAPRLTHAPALLLLLILTWAGTWALNAWLMGTLYPASRQHIAPWLILFAVTSLLTGYWTLRPQILSALFWPFLLLILWYSVHHPRWLWALIPLTILWSNTHGDYLLILLLLGVEGAFAVWTGQFSRLRRLITWMVIVTGLIILGTPNHLQTIINAVQLSSNPWIHRGISEWFSPNFGQTFWLTVLILWIFAMLAIWHRTLPVRVFIWWGGTVVATLLHNRFFLYNAPLTAILLASVFLSIRPSETPPAFSLKTLGIAALIGFVAFWTVTPFSWSNYLKPQWPSTLIAWTQKHPTPGILLVPYADGGAWEAAQVPRIYIDGRADLFLTRSTRFQTYLQWNQGFLSSRSLTRQGVTEIIWSSRTPWNLLLHTTGWHPVFHADHLTVWRRSSVDSEQFSPVLLKEKR
jgi:general stress protein CsbA